MQLSAFTQHTHTHTHTHTQSHTSFPEQQKYTCESLPLSVLQAVASGDSSTMYLDGEVAGGTRPPPGQPEIPVVVVSTGFFLRVSAGGSFVLSGFTPGDACVGENQCTAKDSPLKGVSQWATPRARQGHSGPHWVSPRQKGVAMRCA